MVLGETGRNFAAGMSGGVEMCIRDSSFARVSASMVSTVTCPVNALVDATPIYGPT